MRILWKPKLIVLILSSRPLKIKIKNMDKYKWKINLLIWVWAVVEGLVRKWKEIKGVVEQRRWECWSRDCGRVKRNHERLGEQTVGVLEQKRCECWSREGWSSDVWQRSRGCPEAEIFASIKLGRLESLTEWSWGEPLSGRSQYCVNEQLCSCWIFQL